MARMINFGIPSPMKATAINSEDLAMCKRDRDFTNILDLKFEHHNKFIRNLRQHVELSHTWKEIRASALAREFCVDGFLDIYGAEYWSVQNRSKYIMSDSLARGDEVRYPADRNDIKKTLTILLKKKADGFLKDTQAEEPTPSPARRFSRTPAPDTTREPLLNSQAPGLYQQQHKNEEEKDKEDTEDEAPRSSDSCRLKRGILTRPGVRITPPNDTSSLSSFYSVSVAAANTPFASSNMSTLNLVDESVAKSLHAKYLRDTFFLVSTDQNQIHIAPTWVKFQDFKSASTFLLDMGRELGLEKQWWTPSAQMEVEGGARAHQADYVSAAQDVIAMASVKFMWSEEEVLIRWGNDSDWGIVTQFIQKAWVAKEFGHGIFDLFKVRVVIHLGL